MRRTDILRLVSYIAQDLRESYLQLTNLGGAALSARSVSLVTLPASLLWKLQFVYRWQMFQFTARTFQLQPLAVRTASCPLVTFDLSSGQNNLRGGEKDATYFPCSADCTPRVASLFPSLRNVGGGLHAHRRSRRVAPSVHVQAPLYIRRSGG